MTRIPFLVQSECKYEERLDWGGKECEVAWNVYRLPFLLALYICIYIYILLYFILSSWRNRHLIESLYPKNKRGYIHIHWKILVPRLPRCKCRGPGSGKCNWINRKWPAPSQCKEWSSRKEPFFCHSFTAGLVLAKLRIRGNILKKVTSGNVKQIEKRRNRNMTDIAMLGVSNG